MQHFVPSDHALPLRILAEAFPPLPPAVVRAALEAHTRPGDIVIDPFCISPSVIQAALELDRRVVAASFNPINILAIEATLWPSDARAALTHLADAVKGTQRLREHVLDLYATACPTCRRQAVVLRFEWDRDRNIPLEKHVICTVCGENIGAADAADVELATRFKSHSLPFWTLHSRVIDRNHEEAERVSDVLDAYTPRAQNALGDILLKFEGLSEADRTALRPALLATLDAATSLHSSNEGPRVIGLKPPPRFIEQNLWLELERQVSLHPAAPSSLRRVATLDELLKSSVAAVALLNAPAREIAKQLPPQSVALLISHPPQPRPGLWSLSAVWAAWLWGKHASESLWPLLSRKRTNWDWQWRAMSAALKVLNPVLRDSAPNIMICANDEAMVEAMMLAAAGSQRVLDHLACDPADGVRATWHVGEPPPPTLSLREAAAQAAQRILRERAEPTDWSTLYSGVYAALGATSALHAATELPDADQLPLAVVREAVKQALTQCVELAGHRWWLREASLGMPLADRVEQIVRELLKLNAVWHTDDLLREVYQRFSDWLTPDRALVATCISSYGQDDPPQQVRLRAEDGEAPRRAEVAEVESLLLTLGAQLGFETEISNLPDHLSRVTWRQTDQPTLAFTVSVTAEIAPLMREAEGVLVIPGGRATLLQHKLARDPRLHKTAWQILKFSALRRFAADANVSLETFRLAFGLKPPLEQPATQFRLL